MTTRPQQVQEAIVLEIRENSATILKENVTTVQFTVRLYPKGGGVRKVHFHTESETEY